MRNPISVVAEFFRRGQIRDDSPSVGGGRSPGGPANRDGTNRWDSYTIEQALGISAAIGGVQIIANAVSESDLIIKQRNRATGKYHPIDFDDYPRWAHPDSRPNDYQSREEMLKHYTSCKIAGGNGYIYLREQDRNYRGDYPQTIISVPPVDVSIVTEGGEAKSNQFRGPRDGYEVVNDDQGPLWIGGVDINYGLKAYVGGHRVNMYNSRNREGRLLHSKLFLWDSLIMGYSPFFIGAPPLQIGLEAEQHARAHFVAGGTPQIFLFAEEEENQEKINDFYSKIQDHMTDPTTRNTPYPMAGKWTAFTSMVTPEQSELLDTRRFTVAEVARLLTMPLPLLSADQMTTWGSGVRELIKFFKDITLTPILNGVASDLSQLLPRGMKVFLDPSHLKVDDLLAKAEYYSKALGAGRGGIPWMKPNEVREREDMEPWPDNVEKDAIDQGIEEILETEIQEKEPVV